MFFTDTINSSNWQKNVKYKGWVGYISPVAEFTPKNGSNRGFENGFGLPGKGLCF